MPQEYELTTSEKTFATNLKAMLIQSKANVRDAADAYEKALAEETQVQSTLDGALKMLLNGHEMTAGSLSPDCSKLSGGN